MKQHLLLVSLLLVGCETVDYRYIEVPKPKQQVVSVPDPAYTAMVKCDNLGMKQGETHRLCVMREIDRLKVSQPAFTNLPTHAPIQILPYPYPPLAPAGNITVLPAVK